MARNGIGARSRSPTRDCSLCPRLVEYRAANRTAEPLWHNAPVPSFGATDGSVRLLVVGLAPGLRGANRTGRPFTGDHAGDLLYPTLIAHGFARGSYAAAPDDGLEPVACRITNAVRCVPPRNKPIGVEIAACRGFLAGEIESLARLEVILALGRIAHDAVLASLGAARSAHRFAHGAVHELAPRPTLVDSYHCSRYNVNTGRLTGAMFDAVVGRIRELLDRGAG